VSAALVRRPRPRVVVGIASIALVALACAAISLSVGDVPVPLDEVVKSVLGGGDPGAAFIVRDLRLPRVLLALLVGAALGASGAVFQSLTRNPLGSPDIIGFESGAVTGALVVVTVLHAGEGAAAALGAALAGAATAIAVFLIARRDGRTQMFRIVLVGIGMSALTVSINSYLLSRARTAEAQDATRWLLGSLSTSDWPQVDRLAIALVVLFALLIPAVPSLRVLELGDDLATALGVRVDRARGWLVAIGVAFVAAAISTVGPIAFVALIAPQIARRATRATAVPIGTAALTGATLLLASDLIAQEVLPTPLPAGIVTGALGGLYLLALLGVRARRRGPA
jgi:iron complex transport system permease protein